ncbi:MAG TPA: hypothetical protein ENJ87_10310 [Gammaproteobacteria bacterium]|nr:hypothetical protein [Gammaproteobacteria bacterium]
MLDGNNCSPLDNVLELPSTANGNDPTVNCNGFLPDADFLGVIDADPRSATYGQVVNTAEMPAVYGQHLLSDSDDFVDEALDLSIALGSNGIGTINPKVGLGTYVAGVGEYIATGGLAGASAGALGDSVQNDILGGVPNFNHPDNGGTGSNGLPAVVPAPSSVLNEPHHHSVFPYAPGDGSVNAYYGGLISSNVFGCDISDPLHITPSAGSQLEDIALHADATTNLCGLSVSGASTQFSGLDDLEFNPADSMYYATMMGAGGQFAGAYSPSSNSGSSLPPILTTPGGLLVFDPATDALVAEISAVPTAPVFGHGTFADGIGPQGTESDRGMYANAAPGEMLGPKRNAPRVQLAMGGLDGNGRCNNPFGTGNDISASADVGGLTIHNLCVPGVAPFNQIGPDTGAVDLSAGINEGPDTGLLAHPHGIGLRSNLQGHMVDKNGADLVSRTDANGNVVVSNLDANGNTVTTGGILMTSDYADPVSLALQSGGQGAAGSKQNFGTTVRLWDLGNVDAGPYQVIQMPDGPRHEFNAVQEEDQGLMAMRMMHSGKGAFVASMNGGVLYYSSDITIPKPVFKGIYDFGACTGASVFTITQDDKTLFLPVSGMQAPGDPVYERDYTGEHDARIAVLDLRPLIRAGDNYDCDFAPASAWENTGVGPNPEYAGNSPLGQPNTQGPSGTVLYSNPRDLMDGGKMHPNNGGRDCPRLVDQVMLSENGEPGIAGSQHPDSVTTRGGPHFTTHDRNDRYVATSNYFVDLREFAIKDVDLLLSALGANHGFANSRSGNGENNYPPGGPTDCIANGTLPGGDLSFTGGCPAGGLGIVQQALGVDGGFRNTLPGLGSVGDDTICMMKWNRKKKNLKLDARFNAGDASSPTGCNDMDFGDTGKSWPVAGARNPGAGNGTPHGMSFIKVGSNRFFTNGEL